MSLPSSSTRAGAQIAAEMGLAAVELARVVAWYHDVQTVLSAALKLLPLDPADATASWARASLAPWTWLALEVSTLDR